MGLRRQRNYSVAQLCELYEQKKIRELMSAGERIHIEAHSDSRQSWVTLLPLSFKGYNMTSAVWRTSVLKRLRQDVLRFERQCTFCKWSRGDLKGNHAIMCAGGCARILRHNTVRDIIAKAVRELGYRTDIEHGGGLGDDRRPGDVIVYNWSGGKHLLIDVAVINPLSVSHTNTLIKDGVGGAATEYESIKRTTYSDIDPSKYEFIPFVIESSGGVGQAALSFCKELEDRREAKEYWKNITERTEIRHGSKNFDPLLTAVNVEVQKFNSRMILERQPPQSNLIQSTFIKCEAEVAKKRAEASKSLYQSSCRKSEMYPHISCSAVSLSTRVVQSSPPIGAPKESPGQKWPPDPNITDNGKFRSLVQSTVPFAEHPLAIPHQPNSQLVSTANRDMSSVWSGRNEKTSTVVPSKKQENMCKKDPSATEWVPPKLGKRRRT